MMRTLFRKRTIVIAIILAAFGVGIVSFFFFGEAPEADILLEEPAASHAAIGVSVEGRAIEAYTFGDGNKHLLFVGGVHGGYEWNSVLLSYQFIDYFEEHPEIVPEYLTVTVIPNANPDGVYEVVGKEERFTKADVPEETSAGLGRFNANEVDLNRNFDCKWQPESMWRDNIVSAGSAPFSEPESRAIRDFVMEYKPDAVIFWHSQSNAVYASECEEGILPETLAIMNAYSRTSGYPAVESFEHYEITGDAEGWLASIHIPAITVELSTHEAIEWEKNLAGIMALFEYYRER